MNLNESVAALDALEAESASLAEEANALRTRLNEISERQEEIISGESWHARVRVIDAARESLS